MSKRIAGFLGVALLLIVMVPEAAAAQKSARIRATARVVESVVPETLAATQQELSQLSQHGADDVQLVKTPIGTKRGIAHVYTECLIPDPRHASAEPTPESPAEGDGSRTLVRITVAYTAN